MLSRKFVTLALAEAARAKKNNSENYEAVPFIKAPKFFFLLSTGALFYFSGDKLVKKEFSSPYEALKSVVSKDDGSRTHVYVCLATNGQKLTVIRAATKVRGELGSCYVRFYKPEDYIPVRAIYALRMKVEETLPDPVEQLVMPLDEYDPFLDEDQD